jgi:hypothetical protein
MRSRITFCSRCRGMKSGWNRRYMTHCLICKKGLRYSSRLVSVAMLTSTLLFALPERSESVSSEQSLPTLIIPQLAVPSISPTVLSVEDFLRRNDVREDICARLAESIVSSAKKYHLDAKLIASITIVESRGNPLAISNKAAVGVMQIHIPTWGDTAAREDLNLFKIEDNIDLGSRILKTYVGQSGLWNGVKRYNGFIPGDPESEQSAQAYADKVQQIYGL